MQKVLVLGAGITGLACAHYLNEKCKVIILEKNNYTGGLCHSFEIDGFWFDYGGHVSFTKDEEIRKLFEENVSYTMSVSIAFNYKNGIWVKHPAQNNISVLNVDEKIHIIKDFIERKDDNVYANYADWLEKKYGKYFAINYPYLYTRKYWTVSPEQLETKWIGPRMYTPSIEEVLYGSYSVNTPDVHYSNSIRYPNGSGFSGFIKNMSKNVNIKLESCIKKIIPEQKMIYLDSEKVSYDRIISTIPLPEILQLMDNVPIDIKQAGQNLNYTSLILVSLGVKNEEIFHNNMNSCYVYDEDKLTVRVYSTSKFGKGNSPKGCSTIQAEVYISKYKTISLTLDEIKKKVIEELIEFGFVKREEIIVSDVRMVKYANIMFTADIYDNRNKIHQFLEEKDILYAGRFADWDYLWTDQSVNSAKNVARKLLKEIS